MNTNANESGGGSRGQWRRDYEKQCQQAARQGVAETPWEQLTGGFVLGDQDLLEEVIAQDKPASHLLKQALLRRPDWPAIVRAVENFKGENWSTFQGRHGYWGLELALYLGRECSGLTWKELANRIGSQNSKAVAMAATRFSQRLQEDLTMKKKVMKIRTQLWNVES